MVHSKAVCIIQSVVLLCGFIFWKQVMAWMISEKIKEIRKITESKWNLRFSLNLMIVFCNRRRYVWYIGATTTLLFTVEKESCH